MRSDGKQILVLLGGLWHDFDGFASAIQSLLEPLGHRVVATYDVDTLTRLHEDQWDLVLSYTCLSPHREGFNDTGPERLTEAQIGGLTEWIRSGGALLAVHAATVIGKSDPALGELIGGVFVSHPPPFTFTVYPIHEQHPITAGIEAFDVHDEFYRQTHSPGVHVHMVAIEGGMAFPMTWSKTEGRGRVAYVAPGHSREVWGLAPYQRLLLQAMDWLGEGNEAPKIRSTL